LLCIEAKIEYKGEDRYKLTWVCFQSIYWKCLFCLRRQTQCWAYFAFSRTRLKEFWIWNCQFIRFGLHFEWNRRIGLGLEKPKSVHLWCSAKTW